MVYGKKKKTIFFIIAAVITSGFIIAFFSNVFNAGFIKNSVNEGEAPYKIIWYHLGSPQEDANFVFQKISQYTREKINATVEIKLLEYNDYEKKIKEAICSRENFDLCFTSPWLNDFRQNIAKGAFIELDSLLSIYGSDILKSLPPDILNTAKMNGRLYSIPSSKTAGNQWAVKFNKKYIDKYRLKLPENIKFEELKSLEPMLAIIKEKEPGVIPYLTYPLSCHAFAAPFNRVNEYTPGALYYDNRTNYRIFNDYDSPDYFSHLKLMHKWHISGYMMKDAAYCTDITPFLKEGNWFSGVLNYVPEQEKILSDNFGYEILSVPIDRPVLTSKDAGAFMQAISSTSQDPVKVMKFLNLLYSDKYLYNLVIWGIEGRNYVKKSENIIDYSENIKPYKIDGYTLGNWSLSYIPSYLSPSIWEEHKKFDEAAIRSPLFGFEFDQTPVKNEVEAIAQLAKEFEGVLNVGAVDPEVFVPKVKAKYKAAGLDRVIHEEQKQLDTWLLKK